MSAPERARCTTGKRSFETRADAVRTLRRIHDHPETWRAYVPERVENESCVKCGGYHLTSKANKPHNTGKRTVARRRPKQRGKRALTCGYVQAGAWCSRSTT